MGKRIISMADNDAEIGEIRQNKATSNWVIFAPSRGKRPHDFKQVKKESETLPVYDPDCPFCPGNEHLISSVILELPAKDLWQTRVIPNKFPALVCEGGSERSSEGIHLRMPGYGRHEVIIESPRHNRQTAAMTVGEVGQIVETYHQRYIGLMQEHRNMMTIIFRNHGWRAGTSLIHPHSQIIVTGMVPQYIRWREAQAQRYFDQMGRCVFCDILEDEIEHKQRVVIENTSFVGFVPFAAEVPLEVWIMPKKHQADFGNMTEQEKRDLAQALQDILSRLYVKLNDPHYNYIINTSARYRANEPQLHWYLQIRPRLTLQAGFEIGSGMHINPSIPEEDARFLNE